MPASVGPAQQSAKSKSHTRAHRCAIAALIDRGARHLAHHLTHFALAGHHGHVGLRDDAAAAALGVGTLADLADYHRQRPTRLRTVIDDAGLVPVGVEGWNAPAWADPNALRALSDGLPRTHRTSMLSPFDSLIWGRERTERIFGMAHRLEAYVPAPKRVFGYFAMPVLSGGRIVARVDPVRRGPELVAKTVTLERPSAVGAVARALVEAAGWVGSTTISVERVVPDGSDAAMRAALAAAMPAT